MRQPVMRCSGEWKCSREPLKPPSDRRTQRHPGQEIWRPNHHERRRHRGEGNRARGSVRKYGSSAGPRGASKTSDVAGDGTTTATVLAESIFREGLKNVTAGANPTSLQRG